MTKPLIFPVPKDAPKRYLPPLSTHAGIYKDGSVAVGKLDRHGYIHGYMISSVAPSLDEPGLIAALMSADRDIKQSRARGDLCALGLEEIADELLAAMSADWLDIVVAENGAIVAWGAALDWLQEHGTSPQAETAALAAVQIHKHLANT